MVGNIGNFSERKTFRNLSIRHFVNFWFHSLLESQQFVIKHQWSDWQLCIRINLRREDYSFDIVGFEKNCRQFSIYYVFTLYFTFRLISRISVMLWIYQHMGNSAWLLRFRTTTEFIMVRIYTRGIHVCIVISAETDVRTGCSLSLSLSLSHTHVVLTL